MVLYSVLSDNFFLKILFIKIKLQNVWLNCFLFVKKMLIKNSVLLR